MKRLLLRLVVAAVMAAMVLVISSPAIADPEGCDTAGFGDPENFYNPGGGLLNCPGEDQMPSSGGFGGIDPYGDIVGGGSRYVTDPNTNELTTQGGSHLRTPDGENFTTAGRCTAPDECVGNF